MRYEKSGRTPRVLTNGGYQKSTLTRLSPGFFDVWYNKNSMLNILSFAEVRNKFRITIDTDKSATMNVHIGNGKIIQFQEL